MKREWIVASIVITCVLILGMTLSFRLGVLAMPLLSPPQPQGQTGIQTPLPAGFTYQGQLKLDGKRVEGTCTMAFRLFDAETGGTQVGTAITSTVVITEGLFTETLDFGMEAGVFNGEARWLDIQVRCDETADFEALGRQAITAVPYAFYAQKTQGYENLVIVAKSGGDYTSIQAAVDSVDVATLAHPTLVWVAPGVYNESVKLKPYVHLQGAGQGATIISSTVSGNSPPTIATVVLTHHVNVRDLTVINTGIFTNNVALLAHAATSATLVSDVTAQTLGGGIDADDNSAVYVLDNGTNITLLNITALGANGKRNRGLLCTGGAATHVQGGTFVGRGGNSTYGIQVSSEATSLKAENVIALGENSSNINYGLYAGYAATATLKGGSFTGRGGSVAWGIYNGGFTGATLHVENVSALGENATTASAGLESVATTTLQGGTFTGRGGSSAYGVSNIGGGARLIASGIVAIAEAGTVRSAGFNIESTAQAWVEHARIVGDGNALRLQSSTLRLAVSQVNGSVSNTSSALTCFQVYDNNFMGHSCNP